jgi:hypothetical protein
MLFLQKSMLEHWFFISGISGTKGLPNVRAFPSKEQHMLYENGDPTRVAITLDSFAYDYTKSRNCAYNKEALLVFAKDFTAELQ